MMRVQDGIPFLSSAEMAEADRYAIETLGIGVEALMENAGARTAEVARKLLEGSLRGKKVVVLVGRGNNGGDGLVAARHLFNWGGDVGVILGEGRSSLREVPSGQFTTVEKMGVTVVGAGAIPRAELLIDAMLGCGSSGNPREPLADLIRRANGSGTPILAVDIPSGLDATTGEVGDPCVSARATVTFGLPKAGFLEGGARAVVGDLYLADISLPKAVYDKHGCPAIFAGASLVRLW